jgi:hypothetical protein
MRKKILILFTLISSLAFSDTRDLKMKMVLNKEDVNQILIDIVPENWETVKENNQLNQEVKKEVNKPKPKDEKRGVKKKKNIVKKKVIEKPVEIEKKIEVKDINSVEELKKEVVKAEDIKPIVKEEKIATPSVKEVTKIEEEKKDSKIQVVVWSIVGAFALIFNRIIKKNKGGK